MALVEASGITDVGQKRKANEDAMYLDDDLQFYVVSDGMGGHQAGEVASELVIETLRDFMKRDDAPDDLEAEETLAHDDSLSPEAQRLLAGILRANRGVHKVAQTNEKYQGMGATVSSVLFTDDALIAANVGDSPIYLIHGGEIELISVTHNVYTEQAAINPAAAERLGKHYGHMLTRAMGIEENVRPDISEIPYFAGDRLVISSDGLSDLVSPREIFEVATNKEPREACQTLVDMANQRGGHDNITVIVLWVKGSDKAKKGFRGFLGGILRVFFR